MNFDQVPIISFNDELGNTFAVRDKKDIDSYVTDSIIDNINGTFLDDLASRQEIFGDGAEDLSTAIFEANIEAIVEAGLDEGKVKKLIIPVIQDI